MERLKLRGIIIEKYGTLGSFAAAIGITSNNVTNVLAGKTTPTRKKIPLWCAALDIAPEEACIFFCTETSENRG